MYLTRLDFDRYNRNAGRILGNAHVMHSVLCRACGGTRKDAQILYRVVDVRDRLAVYVYSTSAIDRTALSHGLKVGIERDLTSWLENLQATDRFGFELVTIPSKKVHRDGASNSRRVLLNDPDDRMAWAKKKLEEGCHILRLHEGEELSISVRKLEQNPFRLHGYRYTGILQITDADNFRNIITHGIGPEKAYGYGMLLVTPV